MIAPTINPIALEIGPLAIHWYGIMYLVGFLLAWLLGRVRIQNGTTNFSLKDLEDIIFFGVIGVVIGGRLGYVLFYKFADYLSHPMAIFQVWQGGMSFHGGLIGVIVAMWLFARKRGYRFFEVSDFIAPLIPLGLAAGRLGNFINGELWGRPTDMPWGMIFPYAADGLSRHPSQIYEMATEGLLLFLIIWIFSSKPRPIGQTSGLFLIAYGCFRFLVEFTREPDNFLGLLAGGLSMGQLLSIPMIVFGAIIIWRATNKPRPE